MAIKITSKPGVATITTETKHKGKTTAESTKEEIVPQQPQVTENGENFGLCDVEVSLSYTRNIGNFNSVKAGVTLKIPCPHQEIDAVFTYTKDWTEKRLESLVNEMPPGV